MKKAKVLSCIISLVLSMNIVFSGLNVSALAYDESSDQYSGSIDNPYVGTEHAYDPMAELEAEEAERKYRENADIEANKVLFSVIADENGSYLSDNSDICRKYELHNVKMIYESGNDACEVFYEAETSSDDIWSLVDKLRDDECIASAEPAFVWKKSAIGEPTEVAEAEFKRASHFSLLDTENVWKSLKNSSTPGKGVVIAVIDTGVNVDHSIFKGRIASGGRSYVTTEPTVDDEYGHGSHVAGIIVDNTPSNVKILPIKALGKTGKGSDLAIANAVRG